MVIITNIYNMFIWYFLHTKFIMNRVLLYVFCVMLCQITMNILYLCINYAFSFFNDQDPWSYEEDKEYLEAFFTKLFSHVDWWENFKKDSDNLESNIARKWMKTVRVFCFVLFCCLYFFFFFCARM